MWSTSYFTGKYWGVGRLRHTWSDKIIFAHFWLFDFKKHFFENKYLIICLNVLAKIIDIMFDSVKVWWKLSVRAGMRWSESLQSIIFNDV